jgi:hypothetical protein
MKSKDKIMCRIKEFGYISGMQCGIVRLPDSGKASVVWGDHEGGGWEHVSVSPADRSRTPTWKDMCYLKNLFWEPGERVIQIHPAADEYVNLVDNCLHLWRHPDMMFPD